MDTIPPLVELSSLRPIYVLFSLLSVYPFVWSVVELVSENSFKHSPSKDCIHSKLSISHRLYEALTCQCSSTVASKRSLESPSHTCSCKEQASSSGRRPWCLSILFWIDFFGAGILVRIGFLVSYLLERPSGRMVCTWYIDHPVAHLP